MAAPAARPWSARADGGGLTLVARLTPRGGRDRIAGVVADADGRPALAARVSVPAEGGKANAALIALLARALGVPARTVRLERGATSRRKRLAIDGDAAALAARLEELVRAAR